jgi:DNA helicase-2/ATP-dependent DNA helicase PcrA
MSLGLPQKFSFFGDKKKCVEIIDAMLRFSELFMKKTQRKDLAKLLAEHTSEFDFILRDSSNSKKFGSKVTQQLVSISEVWKELSANLNPQMSTGEAFTKIVATTDLKEQILKGHVQKQAANDAIRAVDILIEHADNKGLSLGAMLIELDGVAQGGEADAGAVVITSVHKSKGCEWPFVIIPKLEEGRFPHVEGEADKDDIEEERRLFYVAITRAIEGLALIAPQDEFLVKWLNNGYFGSPSKGEMQASRFLYETGWLRAQCFCSQIYQEVAQDSIQVGDKEFLYKN